MDLQGPENYKAQIVPPPPTPLHHHIRFTIFLFFYSGTRPQLLKSETVVQFGLSSQRMSFMGQVYDGKTVWQLFHSVLITSARHVISVHRWLEEFCSDINVKHVQNPARETSLKCFFSLQDKLFLLLDHLQALDMPPVTVALTRHICFLSRFTRSFFFSPSPPQLRRRSGNGAAGRSRGGALCRRFTTAIRSALSHCSSHTHCQQSATQSPS